MVLTNCLLISQKNEPSPSGGRSMLCKLNNCVLADFFGHKLTTLEVTRVKINRLSLIFRAFNGHIDGVNVDIVNKIIQDIGTKKIDLVFVDGSNFGEIIKRVKIEYPRIKVCTFFHNVEARFFWGAFNENKSLHSLAVLMVNYLAEKKSVKFSDKIICLSERDSNLLNKIYGRKATNISAIAIEDKLPLNYMELIERNCEKYVLFVGGNFYANRVGIEWFVKYVASRINIKVYVVGKGLERYKSKFELVDNVVVVGSVNSLAEWYLNAQFVIAPIFDGSGMKTKVAEALMYGKRIIGTPEAFSGYEDIADNVGHVCRDANEFVAAIEGVCHMEIVGFDKKLRIIYNDKYSLSAAKSRFINILDLKS
jgi:hypothetical protein